MNTDRKSAEDDLAFLRGLVDQSNRPDGLMGELFVSGGVLYSLQTLYHWAQAEKLINPPGWLTLAVVVAVTGVFLTHMTVLILRHRKARQPGGTAPKAINAVFTASGYTNGVIIVFFATVAWRQHSFIIWLIYPCMVFVVQGAAWMVAAAINRRRWYAMVGLGWYATTVALGLTIGTTGYMLVLVAGLLLLMALPGYILMRQARRER